MFIGVDQNTHVKSQPCRIEQPQAKRAILLKPHSDYKSGND